MKFTPAHPEQAPNPLKGRIYPVLLEAVAYAHSSALNEWRRETENGQEEVAEGHRERAVDFRRLYDLLTGHPYDLFDVSDEVTAKGNGLVAEIKAKGHASHLSCH